MKKRILLTGGGTGGHIYPLIAVGNKIKDVGRGDVEIRYMGPKSKWISEIVENNIGVHTVVGAKLRRYFDLRNFVDIPKFLYSIIQALFKMFFIMPDIVFSKGGPGSFPVVLAARFYMIPVVVHESDSVPSLTTKMTSKMAKRVGVSFDRTAKFFSQDEVFVAGNPIRKDFLKEGHFNKEQAKSYLGFESGQPLVVFMGGSQGAARINSLVFDNLDQLISEVQVFHLVGPDNVEDAQSSFQFFSEKWSDDKKKRYIYKGHLSSNEMATLLTAADLVVSRAGSGSIFELAAMGVPSILVPLDESAGDHQRKNAYQYADRGGSIVVEESNFTLNLLLGRIKSILENPRQVENMSTAARNFAKPKAADTIASEIFKLL